jgi:hypothetical protein
MQLDDDINAAKKIRIPWWGALCIIFGALPAIWLFDHFGRFDLALPALCSIGMLVFAIVVKWKLRRHVWFWITIAIILALHILLIWSVAWTTRWIPAVVIIPFTALDLFAILAIVSVVQKSMERPEKL